MHPHLSFPERFPLTRFEVFELAFTGLILAATTLAVSYTLALSVHLFAG